MFHRLSYKYFYALWCKYKKNKNIKMEIDGYILVKNSLLRSSFKINHKLCEMYFNAEIITIFIIMKLFRCFKKFKIFTWINLITVHCTSYLKRRKCIYISFKAKCHYTSIRIKFIIVSVILSFTDTFYFDRI